MNGIVTGGWGFVWSAYLITAVLIGGYAVSLVVRFRAAFEARRQSQR